MTSNTAAEPGAATRATRPSSSLEWPPQLLEELPEEAAVLAGDYAANEAAEKLVADTVDAMFAVSAIAHEACGMMLWSLSFLTWLCYAMLMA